MSGIDRGHAEAWPVVISATDMMVSCNADRNVTQLTQSPEAHTLLNYSLGGALQEQMMLKGHLRVVPRVIY